MRGFVMQKSDLTLVTRLELFFFYASDAIL